MSQEKDMEKDLQTLQTELDAVRTQAEEYLNGWKRAQADYQNLKKEMEKEKVELAKFANLSLILELLPIADNFDRAMQHLPEDLASSEWVKGVTAIHQQLQSVFSTLGLEQVPTDGEFNPELHEALGHEAVDGTESGHIVEVLQPGYTLHGKLLRPAHVKIAS